MANLGQQITKKLTTGRLFFQLPGAATWTDYGNVTEYKYDPKITRKEHMRSSGGFKRTDMSLASAISPLYQVLLDEHTPALEQLRQVGTQQADAVQAGGAIVNEQLCNASSVQGQTYFTANLGIVPNTYTVKVGATVLVEGTDYAIDIGSGAVTILNGAPNVPANSTVTISYTAAGVTMHVFDSFLSLFLQGNIKIVEYDQFSTVPREITTFSGQLYVSNWGDNKEDYNVVTVDAIPLTNPVVMTRAD